MQIRFHGAVNGQVTGSCTEFFYKRTNTRFLVDCGMVQGEAHAAALNARPFAFDPRSIKFVLLTHAHLDHCGLLPKLCKDGFIGKVFCARATAEAAKAIMLDSAGMPDSPYEKKDVSRVTFEALDDKPDFGLSRPRPIDQDLFASFTRSAHLPGAVSITLQWQEDGDDMRHITMSGDIGPNTKDNPYQSLLAGRQEPYGYPDYIVLESTYGDRLRDPEFADRDARLKALDDIVRESVIERSGPLVIPCFSMQRTQEVLFDLYCLYSRSRDASPFTAPLVARAKFEEILAGEPINERLYASLRCAVEERCHADGVSVISAFVERRNGSSKPKYVLAGCSDDMRERLRHYFTVARVAQPLIVHLESPLARRITEIWRMCLKDRQKKKPDETVFRNRRLKDWLGLVTEEDVDRVMDEVFSYADPSNRDSGTVRVGGLTIHYGNSFEIPEEGDERPVVVISSGGMCEGGPIVNLLPTALRMGAVTIAVTGYMAKNTAGARMVEAMGPPSDMRHGKLQFKIQQKSKGKIEEHVVELDYSEVKARMADLRGYYSGHADLNGLCEFALRVGDKENVKQSPKPVRVILNHGSQKAMMRLKQEIEARAGKDGLRDVASVDYADGQGRWFDLDKGEVTLDENIMDKLNSILREQAEIKAMLGTTQAELAEIKALLAIRLEGGGGSGTRTVSSEVAAEGTPRMVDVSGTGPTLKTDRVGFCIDIST